MSMESIFQVVGLYSLKIFRLTFFSHFLFPIPSSSLLTSSFI